MWLLSTDPDKQRQQIRPSCHHTNHTNFACLLLEHFCNDFLSSLLWVFYWYILFSFLESHISHFLGECKSFPPFYKLFQWRFTEKDFCVRVESLAEPGGLRFTFQPHPVLVPISSSVKGRWQEYVAHAVVEGLDEKHACKAAHCCHPRDSRASLSGMQQSVLIVKMAWTSRPARSNMDP